MERGQHHCGECGAVPPSVGAAAIKNLRRGIAAKWRSISARDKSLLIGAAVVLLAVLAWGAVTTSGESLDIDHVLRAEEVCGEDVLDGAEYLDSETFNAGADLQYTTYSYRAKDGRRIEVREQPVPRDRSLSVVTGVSCG